jgi:tripartite-type tricarboxylate transporter receptor subunit TctC
LPGLYITTWRALWAPRTTPATIIARLNAAVVEAPADPALRRRLTDDRQDIPAREQQTPQALFAFHKAEIDKWWPLVKTANIKME